MKLYLISAILLLVPLAFADRPIILAKILYSDGYVLTESSYAAISYQRDDSFLDFNLFGYDWPGERRELLLSNENMAQSMKDAQLSFVVEALAAHISYGSNTVDYEFCSSNSSLELRPLIERCSGLVRLRNLRPEESSQMAKLKAISAETKNQLTVLYEKKRLVSKTTELDKFTLHAPSPSESLNIAAYREPYVSLNVLLEDYADKQFVVHGPAGKSNCDNPPVEGLRVSFCHGRVQISERSESAKPPLVDGNQKIFGNGAKSLNDLNQKELRKLLKAVVARM